MKVLLSKAEGKFDIFVTVDRNLSYQQNLSKYNIAVIVLKARSNRLLDLRPMTSRILKAIPEIKPGQKILISA